MNFQPQAHDWGQWSLNETRTAVVRRDELASFGQALQWIEQVAALAHAHDHHPEIHNVYNRVQLTLCTHDAGGLTEKDLLLARAIDDLASGTPSQGTPTPGEQARCFMPYPPVLVTHQSSGPLSGLTLDRKSTRLNSSHT